MPTPIPARKDHRVLCLLVLPALLLPVGCANKKPAYAKVGYDEGKLATPPHNLSAHDYPFDDDGTYRKDWVTDKNAKRPKKWFKKSPGSSSSSSATVAMNTPPPPRPSSTSPPPSISPPPSPRPAPTAAPPPAPKPTPPKARYHTVAKGDTLFAISRRYGVSVARIKSTNGLSSDLIRIGQTLRIP